MTSCTSILGQDEVSQAVHWLCHWWLLPFQLIVTLANVRYQKWLPHCIYGNRETESDQSGKFQFPAVYLMRRAVFVEFWKTEISECQSMWQWRITGRRLSSSCLSIIWPAGLWISQLSFWSTVVRLLMALAVPQMSCFLLWCRLKEAYVCYITCNISKKKRQKKGQPCYVAAAGVWHREINHSRFVCVIAKTLIQQNTQINNKEFFFIL